MDLHLTDKTVLITGAARGIGLSCVDAFLGEGARVLATDIANEAGQQAIDQLAEKHAVGTDRLKFIAADMRVEADIGALVAAAEHWVGAVDICINNAAITHRVDFLNVEVADFDRVLATNLRGPFLLGQAVARQLVARQTSGSIVNIGSVNAQLALPDNVAYVASKGGLLQLTRAMALALAEHRIRVNMVAPGSIDTPLQQAGMSRSRELRHRVLSRTPLGRLGRPEEIADAVLYIASERASYITGECVYIDGGRIPLNFTVPVDENALIGGEDK